jgi:hypothetical protein
LGVFSWPLTLTTSIGVQHHGQRHNNPETTQNNAITGAEGGFKGCKRGVKVQKRPFQSENLTEKIPRIYREPDREYDRELKLNTTKIPLK